MSYSVRILRLMNKGSSMKDVKNAVKRHCILGRSLVYFPDEILDTISEASTPPTEKGRKSPAKPKFDPTRLPTEILLLIFGCLDVFDSAALALTCKRLASIAKVHSQVDFKLQGTVPFFWRPYEERHFLKKRLGDNYFSKNLRYCWGCKHYVPRRACHWKKKLGTKGFRDCVPGNKVWDFQPWWDSKITKQMLQKWKVGKALKCPRCKLQKSLEMVLGP